MRPNGSKVVRVKHYTGESRVRLQMDKGTYIEIVPSGASTYLWVGSDSAYFSSTQPPSKMALREFAAALVRILDTPEEEQ